MHSSFRLFAAAFLCAVALVASTAGAYAQAIPEPQVPLAGKVIPKYVDPVPTFVGIRENSQAITVTMEEGQQQVLPLSVYNPLPAPWNAGTYLWRYRVNGVVNYPALTIEAEQGVPTTVTYLNSLVDTKLQAILKVDQTLHWAMPGEVPMDPMMPYTGPVPAVVHLHGGEVPSAFDGGPDSWFTPGGEITGPGYVTNVYTYPNAQEATTMFYHDHTLGATRLNLYAGLAGFYLLRDANDTGLPGNSLGLPAGPYEVELAIQDRMFDSNGQLLFPSVGINPMTHPFWIPEFFGDVIVVNGKSWPFMNVEPRRYRFRIVNGSNARFYEMKLMNRATGTPGPAIWQIGTDGGLLDGPVNVPLLLLGPGERADIIVDFTGFAGQTLTVMNSAKAPYPKGVAPDPQTVGQIMQFRVVAPLQGTDGSYNPAVPAPPPLRTPIVRLAPTVTPITNARRRQLTLNEVMGMGGPLEVLVNNAKWAAESTENPQVGSTEVWEVINLTADAHPIHLHLVQFQLLSRQAFNTTKYLKAYGLAFPGKVYTPSTGPPKDYNIPNTAGALGGNPDVTPFLQGPVKVPKPNENGWKDTFVMYPGEVTRVVVRWAPQDVVAGGVSPGVNLYPFDPTSGPGYVWHCHIVDHEDNEMMRPQMITGARPPFPVAIAGEQASIQEDAGEEGTVPLSFVMRPSYPNPFNPETRISFDLPEVSRVVLKIFNALGEEVAQLAEGEFVAGSHSVTFTAPDLPSGMYIARLQAGSFIATQRLMLMK